MDTAIHIIYGTSKNVLDPFSSLVSVLKDEMLFQQYAVKV